MKVLGFALAAVALFLVAEALPTKSGLDAKTQAELMKVLELLKQMENNTHGYNQTHQGGYNNTGPAGHHNNTHQGGYNNTHHGNYTKNGHSMFLQTTIGKGKAFMKQPSKAKTAAAKTYCATSYMGGDMGYFSSVNYGWTDYVIDSDCSWVIQGNSGDTVTLEFTSFVTEENYDYVNVFDGPDSSSPLLDTLTGDLSRQTPYTITSSGNALTVQFYSDYSITAAGFSAQYTVNRGGGSSNTGGNTGGNAATPSPSSSNTGSSYADDCVYAHNVVRRRHGVSDLVWDDSLAAGCQVWADELADTDSFYHDPNNNYGENLYMQYIGLPGAEYECSDAVFAWYDEVNNPGYNYNNPGFSSGTGHFTQVVWSGSSRVGCATATRESDGNSKSVIACRYDPPGNYNNQFSSNVPRLLSGESYPVNHRELEQNACHDKANSCSNYQNFCSQYDFVQDVCYDTCVC